MGGGKRAGPRDTSEASVAASVAIVTGGGGGPARPGGYGAPPRPKSTGRARRQRRPPGGVMSANGEAGQRRTVPRRRPLLGQRAGAGARVLPARGKAVARGSPGSAVPGCAAAAAAAAGAGGAGYHRPRRPRRSQAPSEDGCLRGLFLRRSPISGCVAGGERQAWDL